MNILANDGISPAGLAALEAAGHRVCTDFVPAEELAKFINSAGRRPLVRRLPRFVSR